MLFTVVIISVTVGISVTMILIAKKQSALGSIQSNAQVAFYAADTGLECGLQDTFGTLRTSDNMIDCTGVGTRPRDARNLTGNALDEVYFFDFARNTNDVGAGLEESGGCGIVVINRAADWGTLTSSIPDGSPDGILVESYGYSTCMEGTGVLEPNRADPTLTERKLIARIPEEVAN